MSVPESETTPRPQSFGIHWLSEPFQIMGDVVIAAVNWRNSDGSLESQKDLLNAVNRFLERYKGVLINR